MWFWHWFFPTTPFHRSSLISGYPRSVDVCVGFFFAIEIAHIKWLLVWWESYVVLCVVCPMDTVHCPMQCISMHAHHTSWHHSPTHTHISIECNCTNLCVYQRCKLAWFKQTNKNSTLSSESGFDIQKK